MKITRRHLKLTALTGLIGAWLDPVLGAGSAASPQSLVEAERKVAGPIVGEVTPNTAFVWMYTPADARAGHFWRRPAIQNQTWNLSQLFHA